MEGDASRGLYLSCTTATWHLPLGVCSLAQEGRRSPDNYDFPKRPALRRPGRTGGHSSEASCLVSGPGEGLNSK